MNRWVIVAGGDTSGPELREVKQEDRLVAVDGGVITLRKAQIPFHIAVGDFDTIGPAAVAELKESGVQVEELPREKDMTDTQAAVELALAEGAEEILILGALGGARFDHSLANLFLLERIHSAGAQGVLCDRNNRLRLYIGDGRKMELPRGRFQYISLLPLSEQVEGLHLEGFRYPLSGATLLRRHPMGISNEWAAPVAKLSAVSGTLLVVESKD